MLTVGFLLPTEFSAIGLAGIAAFDIANHSADKPLYNVCMLSAAGNPVRGSMGITVATEAAAGRHFDLLIVSGGMAPELDGSVVEVLRQAAPRSRRIASVCVGAFLLAEAGLLNGRRATTHWAHADKLQALYPEVKVEADRIFIADDEIWTSAGMTAALDLAVAFVEADYGRDMARTVARKLVMYHRRSGGQSQFSPLIELDPKSDRIRKVLTYARENLTRRLTIEELADVASLSPRQFSRAFQNETGQSPAKAVEHLRLEAARILMEESNHPVEEVARQTGFLDRDRMRRAFLRSFGQPPQAMRRYTGLSEGALRSA
jgi:transcriptional regulator GlxA family with amidase domain